MVAEIFYVFLFIKKGVAFIAVDRPGFLLRHLIVGNIKKSSQIMIKAFVFGKFLPFHKGHEAIINFALTKCNFLTVLICCSDKENIPATTRQKWIEKTFEREKKIEIRSCNYLESELPNTSEASQEVSRVWSAKFRDFFLITIW